MSDIVRAPPIEPTTMHELVQFATAAAKSKLFGVDTPEAALMIAMAGRDLGFSYAQSLRAFFVVKGRPTLSADSMVAAALASGQCDYFRAIEQTEVSATWETQRRGSPPARYTFAWSDAERACCVSDMYRRHPRRMLSARAKAYLARDVYPDLMLGLLTDDEAYEAAQRHSVHTRAVDAVEVRGEPDPVRCEPDPVRCEPDPVRGEPDPVRCEPDPVRGEPDPVPLCPAPRQWLFEIDGCLSEADLSSLWQSTSVDRDAMSHADREAIRSMFSAKKAEIVGER